MFCFSFFPDYPRKTQIWNCFRQADLSDGIGCQRRRYARTSSGLCASGGNFRAEYLNPLECRNSVSVCFYPAMPNNRADRAQRRLNFFPDFRQPVSGYQGLLYSSAGLPKRREGESEFFVQTMRSSPYSAVLNTAVFRSFRAFSTSGCGKRETL